MPPAIGDDVPFCDLYLQRADELACYIRRRGAGHDDADDLVSAVFLTAWQCREDLLAREPSCQRAWLYETAINHLRNHWRSQERRTRFLSRCPRLDDDPDIADALTEASEEADRRHRLAGALAEISHADREVIAASLDEVGGTTLGTRLGIAEASARQRLSRARRRLVAALALTGSVVSTFWSVLDQVGPWMVALPV